MPEVSLSSTSLSFAALNIGISSAAQTVALTNTGGATLNFTSIAASGDFAVTNNCGGGLGAGGTCNLSVTFTPTVAGVRTGAITIVSNAPGSPYTLALSGGLVAPVATSLDLAPGWNLVGNGTDAAIDVVTSFGDATKVATVWKWIAPSLRWAFYAPSLQGQALADYAATKGYDVLTTINSGEGFWVNASQAFTKPLPGGTAISGNVFQAGQPYALKPGWNLVAIGNTLTPNAFNVGLSVVPPSAGVVPINLTTLWAWDNPLSKWYFYAPNLEALGGSALTNYITNKGYLDFTATGKTVGPGLGFWVNKP